MQLCVILSGFFYLFAVVWAGAVKQDTGVRSVSVGENVTLRCFYETVLAMHFSWYQQTLGGRLELLSFFHKYDDPSKMDHWLKKNPRFSLQREDGINHLHISDVQLSDSATYFCGSSHTNIVEFGDGVFLSVEEKSQTEIIVQEPTSEIISSGGSITFSCTVHTGNCGEGHTVCWFRHGFQPGVLHTQRKLCRPVAAPGPPSWSCTYSLQKNNLNSSDAGTYFCVVSFCGKMLFGSGTEVMIRNQDGGQAAQISVLVQLSVIRIGILLLLIISCVLFVRKKNVIRP